MNESLQLQDSSPGLTDVPGFTAAGNGCDVRCTGNPRLDLTLVMSERPCTAAGVFTTHDLPAAPVRLCRELLQKRIPIHGFVANSGNANACTGENGMRDAREMIALAAKALNAPENSMLVCSTGRIGRAMPMDNIRKGIANAAADMGDSEKHAQDSANAILTSDTRAKTATVRFDVEGKTVTLSGMAKGAGMIQPDMATMLAFVTTDAQIETRLLHSLLIESVNASFNAITVDGDMSTNDTVLLLANGASGVAIEQHSDTCHLFSEALTALCENLAKKIVMDGERVSKCVELIVEGARSQSDAEKVARAIGNSLLVKTSWYGNDPNWGRLADAAGYAGAGIEEEKLDIYYNVVPALIGGIAQDEKLDQWKHVVSEKEFTITLKLNLGDSRYRLLTTDLTEGYVDFNKSE